MQSVFLRPGLCYSHIKTCRFVIEIQNIEFSLMVIAFHFCCLLWFVSLFFVFGK